jgi:hypothetical protein
VTATPAKKTTRRKAAEMPDPLSPQQELAPAALAPVADAARAAIATINTQLTEMDRVEAGLQALETKYAKVVYAVETDKGMTDAKAARKELKDTRVAVEHARVAAKRPVLDLGINIDGKATTIKTRIQQLETPIDQQITVQEAKEAERKADLERRIREIVETPKSCIGKGVPDLELVLEGLNTLPLADFQEYREQAAKAQLDATLAVSTLLTQAKQAAELAELQERQRKEEARKAAIQQAIDAIGASLQQLPMCRTSARVQALLDNVEVIEIAPAVYQEFAAAAREKKAEVIAELVRVRDEKKTAEDARAAAAAAPAPTPAPSPAPAAASAPGDGMPAGAQRLYADEPVGRAAPEASSTHDRINDEGAARLHREFGGGARGPGRSLAGDFLRVMAGPVAPARREVEDPFSAPVHAPSPTTELSISTPQRPSDAEILAVVADHYEVDAATAAAWLRTFDAASALAQQSLIPTT